ncbi:MAG: biopolymer transporter ExbD [Myxococcales bacterium]|nr:biopolymer transporter ExbD [Myxococcales bacterium]MCC6527066.1 biopolymer transporter ExbD [Polyangiaceae bacterium]
MHHVPLAFVLKKVLGHGGRNVNTALNLTSYIDFLLVTVIFLLMSFSAGGEITVDKSITLPNAENVEDVIEAPMVAVNGQSVMVDGTPAGNTRAIRDAGKVQKVDELFELLKRKKELWSSFHPDKAFPGVAILQVDVDVEALVVKSVFQTAAFAGYPNISFMVRKRAKAGGGEGG